MRSIASGKPFSETGDTFGTILAATKGFTEVGDISRVSALVKPHVDAIKDSVEALSGIAKANKGPSFGFKLSSPEAMPGLQGMPAGVQGMLVFTWVF